MVKIKVHCSRSLRSQESSFRFSAHCLSCSQYVKCSDKKTGSGVSLQPDFQATVQYACMKQASNCWVRKVCSRIEFAQDLHAADAVYHQVCSINF